MRAVSVTFVFLLIVSAAFPQTAGEGFETVRESIQRHDLAKAIDALKAIDSQHGALFQANNLDYLAARSSQRIGNTGEAAAFFQRVRARNSILREYATWHLASIARETGNLAVERILLLDLLTDRPGSLLADAARRRLAESYFESKDFDATIGALSALPGTGQRPRELELLFAKTLLFKDDKTTARQKFESIITTSANPAQPDDLALEAVKAIDLIEVGSDQFGKSVAKLSDYDHLKRASIYQFNRDFADARLHFLAIVDNHPTSGLAPDAMYQIGRGYTQISDFVDAVKWYERVGEQHPEHPVNKDALLQAASAYARLHKYREAVSRYERYIQNYPDDDKLDRAYLNIVDVLRDSGEDTEAVNRADKAAEVFKGKTAEAQAVFAKARIRLARTEWANALTDLDYLLTLKDLGGAGIPGGTTRTEVTFLRGLVLEELRRYPEAIDAYLSIPDGRNEYYGWRSTERLLGMHNIPEAKPLIENIINAELPVVDDLRDTNERKKSSSKMLRAAHNIMRLTNDPRVRNRVKALLFSYRFLPSYNIPDTVAIHDDARQCNFLPNPNAGAPSPGWEKTYYGRCDLRVPGDRYQAKRGGRFPIVEELIFLGLFDEAGPELEAALRSEKQVAKLSDREAGSLALAYLRGDRAEKAVELAESIWRGVPADYLMEVAPRETLEWLYPTPYKDKLLQYAPSRGVDPRFLLSIMRQESRFRPNVKSVAAARGLMQFIPDTSNKIALELGRDRFDQNELYYPPTAILFGSQYVGNLLKLFPNQPDAASASYNGGEDNMKRWLGRSKSNYAGRYVPEIGFAQSKDYVWRVMANYRMYQMLYDENLNRK